MKKPQDTRLQNAEFYYNGLQDEKGLALLRDCVKSILDEQRKEAAQQKQQQGKSGNQ